MSQDRTYAASIEQDGDRRAKRFCKTTSWCIVRTFNIVRTKRPVWVAQKCNRINTVYLILLWLTSQKMYWHV